MRQRIWLIPRPTGIHIAEQSTSDSIICSEVVEIAPRLGVLEKLLSEKPYGLHDEVDSERQEQNDTVMEQEDGVARVMNQGVYTFQELLDKVQVGRTLSAMCTFDCSDRPVGSLLPSRHLPQASQAELHEGLLMLGAVQIDSCWRLVDEHYLGTVLELIVSR